MKSTERKKNVVVIGGGTGTFAVLSGLKAYTETLSLTAVIAMSDNGSSTGRLRDEFGALPVGDVRMALLALQDELRIDMPTLRSLLMYRFEKGGEGLSGHNFGNLLLVALADILSSEEEAIAVVSRLLGTKGTVLPVTLDSVSLMAEYDDGVKVVGEASIDMPSLLRASHRITHLAVTPDAHINPRVVTALNEADYIVLGPGDLYTSVLATLVVGDMCTQVKESQAKIFYVANLMSRFGQTTGYTVDHYVREIAHYIKRIPEYVVVNTAPIPTQLVEMYRAHNEHPVIDTGNTVEGVTYIRVPLLSYDPVRTVRGDTHKRSLIRHDRDALAQTLYAHMMG